MSAQPTGTDVDLETLKDYFNSFSIAWYLHEAPPDTPVRDVYAAWRAGADPNEVWDK